MIEYTEEIKQEILANVLSTNNLTPEDVKSNWRYDEEKDENWLFLLYPATVGSPTKEVIKTNINIIKQLGE